MIAFISLMLFVCVIRYFERLQLFDASIVSALITERLVIHSCN